MGIVMEIIISRIFKLRSKEMNWLPFFIMPFRGRKCFGSLGKWAMITPSIIVFKMGVLMKDAVQHRNPFAGIILMTQIGSGYSK